MRILAVSFVLPPDLLPQAIQIGRLLAHLPAEIGVICRTPSAGAPDAGYFPGFDRHLAFRENVNFHPRLSGLAATVARRFVPFAGRIPDEYRGWVPRAVAGALSKVRTSGFQPDVMVTFGEPMSDHLVGLRLKRELGVPWVAHFSDPWVDNAFRRHEVLARFVNARLEAQVVAVADRLIFTSDETIDLVMRKYPAAWRAKAFVLPHSFDPASYPAPVKPSGPLTVRYLGNFYGHRSPVPLFRALKLLASREPAVLKDVRFELVGSMPGRMRSHPSLKDLPAGLVHIRDGVPYSQSLALMSASDLLLVIDAPSDVSVFLPSKLIDYLGARVPILGIVPPGAAAGLLGRLGAPVADPSDAEAIASALRSALVAAADRRRSPDWARWGDDAIARQFHVDKVCGDFSGILHDTVSRR